MTAIIHCSCSQLSSTPPLPTTSFGIYFIHCLYTAPFAFKLQSFWVSSWAADLVWHSGLVEFGLRWSLRSLLTQIILCFDQNRTIMFGVIFYSSCPTTISLSPFLCSRTQGLRGNQDQGISGQNLWCLGAKLVEGGARGVLHNHTSATWEVQGRHKELQWHRTILIFLSLQ